MLEKKAKIILQVAQAIGTQLQMSELLASLNEALAPVVHFDAIEVSEERFRMDRFIG